MKTTMKVKFLIFLYLNFFYLLSYSQDSFMFRLELIDKGESGFSIDHPEEFLSPESIERRKKQNIPIDSIDLPIDRRYLDEISQVGVSIKAVSKWLKTVTIHCEDISVIDQLMSLSFIDTAYLVWRGDYQIPNLKYDFKKELVSSAPVQFNDINIYGQGYKQISMLNGHQLHEAGFKGEGMKIAVIDGGFFNSDIIDAFDQNRIIEARDFTHQNLDPFRNEQNHGTLVLSCMLSYKPGVMVGTAPFADYYLFTTEVQKEEYPVEEDYWVNAVEYADSIGIDVINTSLGYTVFDEDKMNHSQSELDGETVLISKAAKIAANKGLLLVIAAGNEGNKSWGKISFPADADKIITVGSVDEEKVISSFSSMGPTADGRVKPDFVAMGGRASVINEQGNVSVSFGTSFATPVLAGVVTCLWQSLPRYTNVEIIELLHKNSDRYLQPDTFYGYGIPNVYSIYTDLETDISTVTDFDLQLFLSSGYLYLNTDNISDCNLSVYNSLGRKVKNFINPTEAMDINDLHDGMYIVKIKYGEKFITRKFIKI